ncbi:MAG: glycosyltransferase family 9 protein [Oligoflexus sp.]
MLAGLGSLPKDIRHVVWLQTSFIGDIILTTAAMQLLRKKAPAVRQYLITTPVGAAALQDQTLIADILIWDKKREALLKSGKRLRQILAGHGIRVDNAIMLQAHKSIRSSLLRRLIGLPTVTYEETLGNGGCQYLVPRVAVFHEAARVALLLQPLGFQRKDMLEAQAFLELAPIKQENLLPMLEKMKSYSRLVAVAPGSVWQTKRWPASNYAVVVQALLKQPDTAVVLLGSHQEKEQAQVIHDAIGSDRPNLFDLVGRTSLRDLPTIYAMLKLLISNDSSPIHYASALQVPTIAIFGATVPAMGFGPLAPGSQVVEVSPEQLDCRPCSDHGPKVCPRQHFRCMKDVLPAIVLHKALDILDL